MDYPKPIKELIEGYLTLPGIGKKTAERLAARQLLAKLRKWEYKIMELKGQIEEIIFSNELA